MRRVSKVRLLVVLFLVFLLLGGVATISITAAEVTFVLAVVFIVIVAVFSVVGSRRGKKRQSVRRLWEVCESLILASYNSID